MRVLVTGGAGYVGAALAPHLLLQGHEVTIIDRLVFGLPFECGRDGLSVYHGDVRDLDGLRSLMCGQNAVVHLAFASNDPAYQLDPEVAQGINVAPLSPLLSAAVEAGVSHFLFLSSCSVYGRGATAVVIDEGAAPDPLTDYAKHKLACEAIVNRFNDTPICCVTLRPATLCGQSPRQRLDLLLNRMVTEAVCSRIIRVPFGSRQRPVLPLSELVALIAHILSCQPNCVRGRMFNAAFDNRSIAEWADLARQAAGGASIVHTGGRDIDGRSYIVVSGRLQRETGFVPRATVSKSLCELVSALTADQYENPMFEPRWSNLATQQLHDFSTHISMRRVI